jgi:hypothetical protein
LTEEVCKSDTSAADVTTRFLLCGGPDAAAAWPFPELTASARGYSSAYGRWLDSMLDSYLGYPMLPNEVRPLTQALAIPLADAVAECAASDLQQGFSLACQKVMSACTPRIHARHRVFYLVGHGIITVIALFFLACPFWIIPLCFRLPGGRLVWLGPAIATIVAIYYPIVSFLYHPE